MSIIEKARELVRNYPFGKEIIKHGMDLWYFNGIARMKVTEELNANIFAESLQYVIRLDYMRINDESTVPIGTSKLKGLPHLPASVKWPKGFYFYAQLNFSELKKHDIDDIFPSDGILYIFFDAGSKFKLIYYNGNMDNLSVTPYPNNNKLPDEDYFLEEFKDEPCKIEFDPYYIFYITDGDAYDYSKVAKLIPQDLKDAIANLLNCNTRDWDKSFRIFGNPISWQGEFECYDVKELKKFISFKNILLLQDEIEDSTFQLWISKKALKKKKFSKCVVTFSGS